MPFLAPVALAALPGFATAAAGATTLATVATIAGTAVTAFGQIASGKAAKAQGRQEQLVANAQADALERQGKLEFFNKQQAAADIREQTRFLASRRQAAEAAGGFTFGDVGSAAGLQSLEEAGELKALQTISGGEILLSQREAQAEIRRTEGDFAFRAGKDAQKASFLNAGTTILGGVTGLIGQSQTRRFRQASLALKTAQPSQRFSSIFDPANFSAGQAASRFVPGA